MLRHYNEKHPLEDGDLGRHTCEICGGATSHGEFYVEWRGVRYVLPVMVFHYIEAHAYCPPPEFLRVLEECRQDAARAG